MADPEIKPGRVFRRSLDPDPPVAVEAHGSTICDADGREYLDAAGGAIVVNVGHGRASIARGMAEQAGRLAYAHGSAFTTEPLEAYAARGRRRTCRSTTRRSTRSPAAPRRSRRRSSSPARTTSPAASRTGWIVFARWGSYHGNTPRRARPVRARAAPPAVRGLARPVPARLARPTRTAPASRARTRWVRPTSSRPSSTGRSRRPVPGTVAAFVAEPIVGATLAAAVPPDGYWPAIADVCRRHGVLLIADEVMTGFGRTGRWFGLDHWGVRPDILVAAKGATSGYWPFGFVAASGDVHDAVDRRRRLRPRLHLLARAGRRRRRARGAADPRGRVARRGEPGEGRAAARLLARAARRRTRTSARSAVAA